MAESKEARNKALVLKAFDTLFNKRDYAAAEKYWSPNYIQHSAHIEPGRDGLFNLIRNSPDTLRYEHQLIVTEGDYVIVHGRFSGTGAHATGSRRIFFASPTVCSPSTGTSCKTKQPGKSRKAGCRCSAQRFLSRQFRRFGCSITLLRKCSGRNR